MRDQCQRLKIEHWFSSTSLPLTNGQVELTYKIILNGLKKKIEWAKGEWAKLLDEIYRPAKLWKRLPQEKHHSC
jgi:hypothetical protein